MRLLPPLHIVGRLATWLLVTAIYSSVVVMIVRALALPKWVPGNEAATALTAMIGTLIVFRNNQAYDRWWEARKLWGLLTNETRNLALSVRAHVPLSAEQSADFARLLIGFPQALQMHLRGRTTVQMVPGFENDPTTLTHAPGYIAGRVHAALATWNRDGRLKDSLWILDQHARSLMDVCGGCERIRNTPVPSSYCALLRIGLVMYLLLAPWAVAMDIGWWAPLLICVGMTFLIGLDLVGDVVEEPFGCEGDDLRLEVYCDGIERFVRDTLECHDSSGAFAANAQPELAYESASPASQPS